MLGLVTLCLVLSSYLGVLTPKLIAQLPKSYHDFSAFEKALGALFLNFILVYLNRVAYQLAINKYVRMLIQHARYQTYSRWIKSPEHRADKYPQGEILSRIMSDTEAIRDLITSGSFGIFIDLCFVISCLIGFISLHAPSGIVISLAEFFATIALLWGSRLMRDVFMKLRNSQANVNRVTANVMGGFHQLYYTRHDQYSSNKSYSVFLEFLEKQNQANNLDAFYYAIAESLYPILLALVIVVFPYTGVVEAALVFAIVDLIQRSISPIKEISGKMANIQRAATGMDRIVHFLQDMPQQSKENDLGSQFHFKKQNENQTTLEQMRISVPFYQYPKKGDESALESVFCLKNIQFQGTTGQLIGIVGLSGCGKSTLLNILAGTIHCPQALVELDLRDRSNNLKTISIQDEYSYKRQVSIVSQESHLFSESLYFNISLDGSDNPELRESFVKEWSFLTDKIPYLKSLHYHIDTVIKPNELSLGQRQLLAGVRACFLKKNVVFIDEISSALDSDLELALRKCILLIQEHSLTIIVAHRIETIIHANSILVMERGEILASGKHQELLKSSPVYQQFIQELSHS
jgi:ABC-type multidrug transport system fused ATPase/permease subunit